MKTATADIIDRNGWAYPVADDFMWREARNGAYQFSHLMAAMAYVTDRRVAIDGGAHVGQFSRPMASLFDRVIAVEPAADTFAALTANKQWFNLENVELKNVALGNQIGTVSLELDAKQAARKNTGGRYVVAGGSIPVERIDDWQLEDVGFIKLDIEGSEPQALEGAVETLQRCRPVVLFESKELWVKFGCRRDAPQRILTRCGYQFLQAVGRDEIWGPL